MDLAASTFELLNESNKFWICFSKSFIFITNHKKKTVYNLNYDKITFDGSSLSVGELKKLITDKAKFVKNKKVDFELELSNADTKEVYTNDAEAIFKNTRILVKRIVKDSAAPLRAKEKPPDNPEPSPVHNLSKNVYDSLAPLNLPSQPLIYVNDKSESQSDEQAKLESILKNSMSKTLSETSIQTCRFLGMKPFLKPPNPTRSIPSGYICMICRKPGHLKQFCPEAANLPKSEVRPKFPSGIPKTTLRPAKAGEKFAMFGPEGYVVPEIEKEASKIVKKEKLLFQDEEEEKRDTKTHEEIPKELKCPLGNHLIKEAVLVPCCGHFICCDECIRNRISNEELIECPNGSCDQEIDSFAGITPYHEMRRKCTEFIKSKKCVNEKKDLKLEEKKVCEKSQLILNQPSCQTSQKITRPIQHSLSESIIRNNVYSNQYFCPQVAYYENFIASQNGYSQNYGHFTNHYDFYFGYQQQVYGYDKFFAKSEQNENLDQTLEIMTEKEFNQYKEKLLNDKLYLFYVYFKFTKSSCLT
ncbi:E3 ubiquitin- ligase RBBP6-like [Brachionus plicatilis]|uniref:E3 ubiquitin-ligase RBBP6-like n=1 Tax=Brachionus plicatilis TaxID=10195 RepID=A0A3M7SJX0_BRAPC|nr:E3 ubiquitin- ligase RBBP6-like [Brachionus plicatilis]